MLKPEVSIGIGLATATVVYGIYQTSLPSVIDARMSSTGDANLHGSRKTATWTAAAVVAGVSLISKDPTVFLIGGAMVIALDWWYRHAAEVNPATGKTSGPATTGTPVAAGSGDLSSVMAA